MAVFMQPIYTQTVGAGGAASVTFNNIPQGFTDLKIVMSVRTDFAGAYGYVNASINGSGQTFTSGTIIQGNGSSIYNGRQTNMLIMQCGDTATANTFGNAEIYITNYSRGNLKTLVVDAVSENNNATSYIEPVVYNWRNTSPITSISFIPNGGTVLKQYSTITLYGISERFDTGTPVAASLGTVTDQAGFASVAFTPAANDRADLYAVTTTPSTSTTYGAKSPIVVPATLDTSYTYQVASVNSLGSSSSSASSALTTFNNYTSIATVYNTTASGITALFTNIPQNYKHLQIRMIGRAVSTSTTPPVYININGDTGTNYSWHYLTGNRSSVAAGGVINYGDIEGWTVPHSSSTANVYGSFVIDILNYNNTSMAKTLRILGGTDFGSSGSVYANSGTWYSNATVGSIAVQTYAGFAQYSHIALYGLS